MVELTVLSLLHPPVFSSFVAFHRATTSLSSSPTLTPKPCSSTSWWTLSSSQSLLPSLPPSSPPFLSLSILVARPPLRSASPAHLLTSHLDLSASQVHGGGRQGDLGDEVELERSSEDNGRGALSLSSLPLIVPLEVSYSLLTGSITTFAFFHPTSPTSPPYVLFLSPSSSFLPTFQADLAPFSPSFLSVLLNDPPPPPSDPLFLFSFSLITRIAHDRLLFTTSIRRPLVVVRSSSTRPERPSVGFCSSIF